MITSSVSPTPTPPQSRLALRLLGTFEAIINAGDVAHFEAATARGLLAYLAMNAGTPQSRARLAELLWGDKEDATAGLTNLRSSLRRVRKALEPAPGGESPLLVDNDTLQMNPRADLWLDVTEFETLIKSVDKHTHHDMYDCLECMEHLERAVELYRGDFLVDLVIDSTAFEDWQRMQQERLQWLAVRALHILSEQRFRIGDFTGATTATQRQLALEPWNEEAHRQLMRIFLTRGQRSAALAQYEACRKALVDEFGTVPSEETDALYAQVSAGMPMTAATNAENPYVGLAPFGVKDVSSYFGRETATRRLLETAQHHSLVALVGPSGCGKSSVLAAGLTATLMRTAASPAGNAHALRIISMRPGSNPFLSLAAALLPYLHSGVDEFELAASLRQGRSVLAGAIEQALEHEGGGDGPMDRLLLIIDQFEELYTLCRDAQTQTAFVDLLLDSISTNADGLRTFALVLAMRVDFLASALLSRSLADALQDHTIVLGPMTRVEMHRAIEEPARLRGVAFEPGLVERLLDDVGAEPGSLPLLQFALAQLWEKQSTGWLTHAAYVEIRGVKGALAHYADGFYAALPPDEKAQAKRIFLALVQPGEGTVDTRRFASRTEIGEAQWPLVQRMADARLVVTDRSSEGEETVELAHEALIREWTRLSDWLEDDRVFRVWQQQMWLSTRHWRESGSDPASLLRGGRLAEAERWMDDRAHDISPAVQLFVVASVQDREQREKQEEAQRALALSQMTALADAEHRRADAEARASFWLRRLSLGLGLAAVLILAVAAFAFQAQRTADEQRASAEASAELALTRQLSAQAIDVADSQVDLAELLALEMRKRSNSTSDINNMFSDLDINLVLDAILYDKEVPILNVAFTSDGQRLVGNTERGDVVSWDLATRQSVTGIPNSGAEPAGVAIGPRGAQLVVVYGADAILYDAVTMQERVHLTGHESNIMRAIFTYDGSHILTIDADRNNLLWDSSSGALVAELEAPDGREVLWPISADGRIVALSDNPDDQDAIDLWDTSTGKQVGASLSGHTAEVNGLSISPDGRLLATASFDGTARLWDTKTGLPYGEPLRGHVGRVLCALFSPDGKILVTGGTDNKVLLWDVASGTQLGAPLLGHGNWVRAAAFSPDGRILATGDTDGRALLWDIARDTILPGHTDRVRSVAISPDGNSIVTSGFDRQLLVWDSASLQLQHTLETAHENSIIQVGFSPNGKTLASLDAGGGVVLWDTSTWQPQSPLSRQGSSVLIGLAFSPDSRELAAGAFDGTIQFWNVETGQPSGEPISAHNDWALALAYSPDGAQLVSGSKDASIRRWDTSTHAPIGDPLVGHTNWVTDLAFAPDGKSFVSSSSDGSIRVWDASTGAPIGDPLVADGVQVWTVAFDKSFDPVQLVSLSGAGSIFWWDWAQRRLVRPPVNTGKETEDMALSPDGRLAVLGGVDSTALAYRVLRTPWEELACRVANRWLTEDEWLTYMGDLPYDPSCARPGTN